MDCATQQLWREEKPDEYFFLEMYGSAVVEHLVASAGARLCAWAEERGMAVLPHYSPGYPEWDIADQPRLLQLVHGASALPDPRARFRHAVAEENAARGIWFDASNYWSVPVSPISSPAQTVRSRRANIRRALTPAAKYQVNAKALRRWAAERLSLEQRGDGTIEALFRYDGTTCNNMGQPLAFEYRRHAWAGRGALSYPRTALRASAGRFRPRAHVQVRGRSSCCG